MKKLLIAAVLLPLAICSCKKKDKLSDPIIGKWDLVLTTGGIAGIHITPAQTGHTRSLQFNADKTGTSVEDGKPTQFTYTIKQEYSQMYQKNVTRLDMPDTYGELTAIYVGDTLTLSSETIADGTTDWFVRH